MPVYVIAQLTFRDRAAYRRYESRFAAVFRAFRGTLLAADARPDVVEGDSPAEKVVLMSFPDRAAFIDWSESSAYREIAVDRKQGADAVVLLVDGLPYAQGADP